MYFENEVDMDKKLKDWIQGKKSSVRLYASDEIFINGVKVI